MKTVGLITEYNPFHNGHKYHIEEAKRITGADFAIAVMSGNFVQRGTPALIDKYSRAEMALRNGVDLVFELPVCYATGSAEYFAHGAVSLLDKLGIVDSLCFGSECGDIHLLEEAAGFLLHTPASFDSRLQELIREGLTYPAARLKALQHSLKDYAGSDGQVLAQILTEPNNILGIEYIKALRNLNSRMLPVTLHRISTHYHSSDLADNSRNSNQTISSSFKDQTISSATAIRKAIHSKQENTAGYFEDIRHSVPIDVYEALAKQYGKTYPITEEDFSKIIKYKLLSEAASSLASYMDISSDLADRLKNITDYNLSVAELTQNIKTKNVTLTRINRALIHLLLNIRNESIEAYNQNGYCGYARILGMKKESSHLLRTIEKSGRIPILTKVSKAEKQLDSLGMCMLSEDIFATHLYYQAVYEKFGTVIPNEYKHGIVLL